MSKAAPPGGIVRTFIRWIDRMLRRHYRVQIYSDHPDCLLRFSPGSSDVDMMLSDGTSIRAGDPLLDLHLWNERLASHVLPLDDLARGRALLRYLRTSLRLLNEWVMLSSSQGSSKAVRAEFGMFSDMRQAEAILGRMGFDIVLKDNPGLRIWRRTFWENLFSMALMWAFNPQFAHTRRLHQLARGRMWMSLAELNRRFSS